jgi:hypothetical protein
MSTLVTDRLNGNRAQRLCSRVCSAYRLPPTAHAGSITLLVLIFGGIFFAVLGAMSGFILSQNRIEDVTRVRAEALSIAEAGLEYYRWHLAHFPTDLQNGTGQPGPYAIPVPDPSGGTAGTASLSITANTACGQTTSVDISSKGMAADDSSQPITVVARYARPSIASYDFVSNASVWIGSTDTVNGPYHSNNGVRMDGTTNAPISSSVSTWTCTSAFGCSPNATEPGVFGSGNNPNLWQYPTPTIDFAGIAANFSSLKSLAQASGIYLPRYSSGNSRSTAYHKGYLLNFNSNGTVSIYRVQARQLSNVYLLDSNAYGNDYALIGNKTLYETVPIPANCGLVFSEDNTWIEGVVPAKATVVVANVSNAGVTPDAFLPGNITYAATSATDGLTVISAHDILITPDSPSTMTLSGVFVAQSGVFGRNYYGYAGSGYEPRSTLTLVGSTVSALQSADTYVDNNGNVVGGYANTIDYPDRMLATDPPPFTPTLSSDYTFVDWQQL